MHRILTIAICLGTLTGCLASSGVAPASTPDPARSMAAEFSDRFRSSIVHLSFSPDGRHFLAATGYRTARLYDAISYSAAWTHEDPDELRAVLGAGFIDSNTLYLGLRGPRRDGGALMTLRTIEPPRPVASVEFEQGGDDPLVANQDVVLYSERLMDWRTGETYRAWAAHPALRRGQLTRSNRVLSLALNGWVRLDDPVAGVTTDWDAGPRVMSAAVTASERHVITHAGNGSCKVWRLPEPEQIESCGRGRWFGDEKLTHVQPHPSNERFAASWGERVRVYDLQPFALRFETSTRDRVHAISMSAGNRLAIGTATGIIEVWDVEQARLLGRYEAAKESDGGPVQLLDFAPDGHRLLAGIGGFVLMLRVPE